MTIYYEIVCVHGGSKSNTTKYSIVQNRCNPAIEVVNLSRNFGKEFFLTAEIDYVNDVAFIPIDGEYN